MNGGQCEYLIPLAIAPLLLGVALGWWLKQRHSAADCAGRLPSAKLLACVRELAGETAHKPAACGSSSSAARYSQAGRPEPPNVAILNIVERMAGSNRAMSARLASADERLRDQAQRIDLHLTEARIDPLTDLANRRAFVDELARRYLELRIARCDFSLLVVDIDHFKRFNDTYGHELGDRVLRAVAWTLKTTMRRMDLVARHGGEEFSVILPAANLQMASLAAQRLGKAVESARWEIEGHQIQATVSIGISQADDYDGSGALFGRADIALYAAKAAGRNCCYRHDGQSCAPVNAVAAAAPADMIAGGTALDATAQQLQLAILAGA